MGTSRNEIGHSWGGGGDLRRRCSGVGSVCELPGKEGVDRGGLEENAVLTC
jgi:hypothetical protein